MRYFQNVDTGNVIAMEDEPQGEWLEIEQEEFESLAHPLSRPTTGAGDLASLPDEGRCIHGFLFCGYCDLDWTPSA